MYNSLTDQPKRSDDTKNSVCIVQRYVVFRKPIALYSNLLMHGASRPDSDLFS